MIYTVPGLWRIYQFKLQLTFCIHDNFSNLPLNNGIIYFCWINLFSFFVGSVSIGIYQNYYRYSLRK